MGRPHRGRDRPLPGSGGLLNLYRLIYPWLPPLIRTVYRLEISGVELVPRHGPLVVVANHLSAIDPFVLGSVVPRQLHFMAKEELWRHRPLAWAMDGLGAFPVGRGRGDRDAVAKAVQFLHQGGAVALFPQGYVRSTGAWLRGAARIALTFGAPVLPVRLFDTDRAVAGRRVGFPRLRATIGVPIPVEPGRPTIAAARSLTEHVRLTIEALSAPTD